MQIISPTNMLTIWAIVKLFFIVGLSVYTIFALVIVRQIQIMSDTIKLSFELPIKIAGIIHLIFATTLLLISIIAL